MAVIEIKARTLDYWIKLLGIIPSLGLSSMGRCPSCAAGQLLPLSGSAILAFIIVTLKSISLLNGLPSSLHLSICPENYLRQLYLFIHPNTVYLPMDFRLFLGFSNDLAYVSFLMLRNNSFSVNRVVLDMG